MIIMNINSNKKLKMIKIIKFMKQKNKLKNKKIQNKRGILLKAMKQK